MQLILGLLLLMVVSPVMSTPTIVVDVKYQSDDTWVVNYQLPEAVKTVFFYREGPLPREQWQVVDTGLQIERTSDSQYLLAASDDAEFQSFAIRFKSDYRTTPKDYELNLRFSDGGVLIYTGHLLLSMDGDSQLDHQFNFSAEGLKHSIVNGQVRHEKQTWVDQQLQGTYVYFGASVPVQTPHMVTVIDQGLPPWIIQRFTEYTPKLFAFYAEKTGLDLAGKPVVYFSFRSDKNPGTQYSGGTLPGLIQLNLSGNDWQKQSDDNLHGLLHFLAHEAAHMWNAQMVKPVGDINQSWIHEGGADAFAVRALAHLGVIDEDQILQQHENYLNACLDGLQQKAVTNHSAHRNVGAHYSCGATIALLTEAAVKQQSTENDLFDFWADLLSRVKQHGFELTTSQYLKSLMLLSDNQVNLINIIGFLDEPQPHPNDFMVAALAQVDLMAHVATQDPKQSEQASRVAFKHLMTADCGTYSYQNNGSYYTVGEQLKCKNLTAGMAVSHIQGVAVESGGHAIFATVKQQCETKQKIQLTTRKNTQVDVSCEQQIPVLRPWLKLSQ